MLRLISAIVLCCGTAVVCLPQQLAAQTSATTANFKPLSKGTVFLYYRSYSSINAYPQRIGTGIYRQEQTSSSSKGYYYSKILADTIIEGQKYGIVYSPNQYVDNPDKYSPTSTRVLERSTPSSIYQYTSGKDELVLDAYSHFYPSLIRGVQSGSDCGSSGDSNTINFDCRYSTVDSHSSFQEGVTESKSILFKRGYGLYQQKYSYLLYHPVFIGPTIFSQYDSIDEQLQFIGAISDGKVLGDSLVLFLDTERNVFEVTGLTVPLNTTATVGQIVDIPITLSGIKKIIEISGIKTGVLTSTLSFNASMLEPIEKTPLGSVSNGIRRIPLSFNFSTQSDTSVISLRFRALVGNNTETILSLDTLRSPNNITIRQKTINGAFQVKGLNYAGNLPALFFSRKAAVALSVKPNPVADNLNISFVLDKASAVELVLTSADGRRIASMTSNIPSDGSHEVVWNAKTQDGSAISSGTYFLQLFVDGHYAAETSLIKTR